MLLLTSTSTLLTTSVDLSTTATVELVSSKTSNIQTGVLVNLL